MRSRSVLWTSRSSWLQSARAGEGGRADRWEDEAGGQDRSQSRRAGQGRRTVVGRCLKAGGREEGAADAQQKGVVTGKAAGNKA